MKILLSILLGLIAIIGSVCIGIKVGKGQMTSQQVVTGQQTVIPNPPTNTLYPILPDSFQGIIKKYCKPFLNYHAISKEDLPVNIDESVVQIDYGGDNKAICWGSSRPDDYIMIKNDKDGYTINLYDDNSEDPGHGGPSYIGSFATVVKDDNNIKYSIWVSYSEGDCAFLLKDTAIIIKGEKQMKLRNGEIFYVNSYKTAIPSNDPRLINALRVNSRDSMCEPGSPELIMEGSSSDILKSANIVKERFFKDFNNLESPEKEAIQDLQKKLNAITPK